MNSLKGPRDSRAESNAVMQALQHARELRESGELAGALEVYEEILELQPTCAAAYKGRGRTFDRLGQEHRACADYDRACAADPRDWEAFSFRALLMERLSELQPALRDLRRATRLSPKRPRLHVRMGKILQRLGDEADDAYEREQLWLDAVDAFSKAFENNHRELEAITARARLFMANECFVAALADFSLCVMLEPPHAEHWVGRGNAFYELGDFARAIRDYQRALELEPELPEVYLNLGCIALDDNRMKRALQHFERALTLDPDYARAFLNRGLTRYYLGHELQRPEHFSEAENDLRQAITLEPRDAADAHFALARLYSHQRRYRLAIEALETALEACPEYVDELIIDRVFEDLRKLTEVKRLVAHAEERLEG